MYLAITLSRLDDFTNSCAAYEKALDMDPSDAGFHLNFAITLFNHGDLDEARKQFQLFEEWHQPSEENQEQDAELNEVKTVLEGLLKQ